MNRKFTRFSLFAISILCLLLAGCSLLKFGESDTEQTAVESLLDNPAGNAKVSFRLIFPGAEADRVIPQIRGASAMSVNVELILARPGIGGSFKFRQTAAVGDNGSAIVSFAGLPALPALGKFVIEGGHIQGWSLFHGAMDLKDGENLFDLAPEGSRLAPDLAASTLRAVLETPDLITSAPESLVSLIQNAIGQTADAAEPDSNSEILSRVITAIQPTSLTNLTVSTDRKSLLGAKNSATVWNLSIQQIFGQQTELASILLNADISKVFRYPVGLQPALVSLASNSDDWQILAAISADTGLCQGYLRVQGLITQVFVLKDGTIFVGGYEKNASTPFLARWVGNQAMTIAPSTVTDSGWQSFFTSFAGTPAVPQPTVESILTDNDSPFVNTAVRNPADNLIRLFSVNRDTGAGADQPINPTVTPNRFPCVELTAPADNSTFAVGAPITLTASATDLDSSDSIVTVAFYADTTRIGEVSTRPYSLAWEPAIAGTHRITVRATDSQGAVGISAPITLSVSDSTRTISQSNLTFTLIYPKSLTPNSVTLGGQSLVQKSTADRDDNDKIMVYSTTNPVNVSDLTFIDAEKTSLLADINISGTVLEFNSAFTATASSLYTDEIGLYEAFIKIATLSPEPDADYWYFNHITARSLKYLTALTGEIEASPGALIDLNKIDMLAGYNEGSCQLVNGAWAVKSGLGTLSGTTFTAPTTGGSTVLTMTYSEKDISESTDLIINTIDRLELSEQNPAAGAGNVSTRTVVSVTFNQDMDTTTIDTTSFQLKKGSVTIPSTISFSDARTFVLTPDGELESSGTQYTVILSTAIKSGIGSPLSAQITWNFTTTGVPITGASELLISEVGSNFYSNYGAWFEVYNNSESAIDLSQYSFKTTAKQSAGDNSILWTTISFSPNLVLPAKTYGLIVGQAVDEIFAPANVALIPANNEALPWWYADGFIEISKSGTTIDFVRFGSDATAPISSGAWSGSNAPALPGYDSGVDENSVTGRSIQRALNLGDSNSGSDWALRAFATPGGMNDVTDDADADGDGIPDCCEQAGTTYIGQNVYDWGARTGQKDVFMHINYMTSTHLGLNPNEQALDKVANVFLSKGYHLHFDVGQLFASGRHNLDGSNSHQIPFYEYISLGNETGSKNLYELKAQYLPLARRQFFYYCVFGNKQQSEGSTGLGECPGNDFLLSLGIVNFENTNYTELQRENYLINEQASTLMHEFGHNLGLRHGGDEELNYKPNYRSIMNYLYSSWGLPDLNNSMVGDRYYHIKWSWEGFSSASG